MELTDLCSIEEWQRFETELFERFGMNCTVYNTSGVGITGSPRWCNRLCPVIKANPDSLGAICAPGNQNFMARARQTRKPVVGECDAGLLKIAVPIFIEGEFQGTAGGCGRLPKGGEVEPFLIEKTAGLSEEKIRELSADIAEMSEAEALQMTDFIQQRIARCTAAGRMDLVRPATEARTDEKEIRKVRAFLDRWTKDPNGAKRVFTSLFKAALSQPDTGIEFHERPGISYSLRLIRVQQIERPLFAMIDVIDDDPAKRWLSVCFYGDMIEDPEEKGDWIPGGLLGADGTCFDIGGSETALHRYVAERIQDAYASAAGGF